MANTESLQMKKLGSSLDLEELSRSTSLDEISHNEVIVEKKATSSRRRWLIPIGICCALTVFVIILVVVVVTTTAKGSVISWVGGDDIPSQCTFTRTPETVTYSTHQPIQLKGATVLDGLGNTYNNYDVVIENGRISYVGPTKLMPNVLVIDVKQNYITPGLIDLHSHLGVYPQPEGNGNSDGNEETDPALPQVRAMDGFNPEDSAIPLVRAGGVTTAQVLPGSADVMGGEGFIVKLKTGTVDDMRVKNVLTTLKMACGENPKRVFGSRDLMPASRMGSAWVMRRKFEEARNLMRQQDAYCEDSEQWKDSFPEDLSLYSLLQLLRHQAVLNIHCYKVQDLEMAIRVSREFNFTIASFHHALEAYKIPDIMKQNNITVATFADMWGFKMEAYDGSVWGPKTLSEYGVPLAIKSDHPVLFSRDLIYEAGKAAHYGVSQQNALMAVTSVPAKALQLFNRIGSIEVGKDGDVVIWDRHPLRLGAKPYYVYIEGKEVYSARRAIQPVVNPSFLPGKLSRSDPGCSTVGVGYALKGMTVWPMNSNSTQSLTDATIIVNAQGIITCIGSADKCPSSQMQQISCTKDGPGAQCVVIPGTIAVGPQLGRIEIELEPSTQDGYPTGVTEISTMRMIASDGIRIQSRHMWTAFAAGVTSAVTFPTASSIVSGLSSAYYTTGIVIDDALVSDQVALVIQIGKNLKSSGGIRGSITGQISALRALLQDASAINITANPNSTNPFLFALQGKLPIVLVSDQADDISSVLRLLKKQFFVPRVVIFGGAEAPVIASKLAEMNVGVILAPARCWPNDWDSLRCDQDNGLQILINAGVTVGLSFSEFSMVRNLRWEAGLTLDSGVVSYADALATVTRNLASFFALDNYFGRMNEGMKANFVVYDGDPLSLSSNVLSVTVGNTLTCNPKQPSFPLGTYM